MSKVSKSLQALTAIGMLAAAAPSYASITESEAQLLVDESNVAVQNIFSEKQKDLRESLRLLKESKAVMICPSVSKFSFLFGGGKGRCLLLNKDARNSWSDPAFFRLSTGSFGLQAGYQHGQFIFFIMSEHGLQELLDRQFKFDAHAGATFATKGANSQSSATAAKNTDIFAVQETSGLFAGVNLGGTKLMSDSSSNRAYYGSHVGPEDIVVTMKVNKVAADPLRRSLMESVKMKEPPKDKE